MFCVAVIFDRCLDLMFGCVVIGYVKLVCVFVLPFLLMMGSV